MTEGPFFGAPWRVDPSEATLVIDRQGAIIADCCHFLGDANGMNITHARAISALPALYEALKAFVDAGGGHDDFEDQWPAARAALALARGERP